MQKIYNSDKPVIEKSNDKFDRYNFSKRIAETIINRSSEDGLVVGLYGAWGEGKTSVLNFLENELNKDEDVIVIKFNPWRFTNEDALLLNFLKNISVALDRQLLSGKEKVGDFIKKFGSIGGIIGVDLSKIGESISDTELETLKSRVNEFLKDSSKKVVIIIDDIDRLDKQELFALFKLVKLTGDFNNTYYILSFDDEMVASAIGERYASGDKNSGHNFLEKIIQVPLIIPKALPKAIEHYTFELINNAIDEAGLVLTEANGQELGYKISQYVIPRISTPRLAVRYANTLAFIIPLLKGEVNHSDLILFEAVKTFFTEHYDFIKSNPEYFINNYDYFGGQKNNDKVKEIQERLKLLNSKLSKVEEKCIMNLLTHLFPKLNEALNNHYSQDDNTLEKNKNIGSSKYFNRYFLYSVPNNELSDVYFDDFLKSLAENDLQNNIQRTNEILKSIDSLELLNKISFYEESIDWITKIKLIELLINTEDKFENIKGGFGFGMNNPKAKAAIAIYRLIKSHTDESERFEIGKKILSEEIAVDFSFEILRWLKLGATEEEKMFTADQYQELNNILLSKALADCKTSNSNLFEKYDQHIFRLLDFWYLKDADELKKYIAGILESDPNYVKTLLYVLTSIMYSSTNPEPYKTDFKRETFEALSKYADIYSIYSKVKESYDDILGEDVKFYDMDEGQNEFNILRQFVYWYDKSLTE